MYAMMAANSPSRCFYVSPFEDSTSKQSASLTLMTAHAPLQKTAAPARTFVAESGIVFGATAALYGEITVKNGRVEQANFDTAH
ncbi:hypothetical protein AAE026_29960 [Bradyrhizobium sp. DN5]|uniref:hypothetical protein n=1 Tax=Bradyrhizobium sp. DN5 TaxID=3056950 RepID=UPI003525C649